MLYFTVFPLSLSVMLSSYEDGTPNLYMIDPSGVSYVSKSTILLICDVKCSHLDTEKLFAY